MLRVVGAGTADVKGTLGTGLAPGKAVAGSSSSSSRSAGLMACVSGFRTLRGRVSTG